MALKKELEELLASAFPDEKDREEQRKLLEKYPTFGEGFLRQSDYDRKMNEVKTDRQKEQEALQTARELATKWQKWADDNKPIHENLLAEYKKITDRNKELEEQVAKAAEGGGGGAGGGGGEPVDEKKLMDKVNAEIAKRGFVSNAEMAKIVEEQARKIAAEERAAFFKETLPNMMEYSQKLTDFSFSHRQEFNEPFDRKAFSKYVADNKIEDMDRAYDMFVGEKRTEKKIKDETEKRVQAELSKRNFPGSGAVPSPELGPIEARFKTGKGSDGLPADATISAAAMAAAAELRAENKV